MEFEGNWKIKSVMSFDDDGNVKWLSAEDIREMDDSEENEDYKNILRMNIIIEPTVIKTYGKYSEEELAVIKEEENAEPDETGMILVEEYPIELIDGEYKYAIGESDGEPYYATLQFNEEGNIIYGETIILERA